MANKKSKPEIRCSSLSLLSLCRGARPDPNADREVLPNVSGRPALIGTFVHELCARVGEWTPAESEAAAATLGLTPYEKKEGEELARLVPPAAEGTLFEGKLRYEFERFVLTGHYDRISFPAKNVILLEDIKTGRKPTPPAISNPQMYGYLGALAELYPEVEKIGSVVHAVRFGGRDEAEYFSRADVKYFFERVEAVGNESLASDVNLTVGEHCDYCRLRETCPARNRRLMSFANIGLVESEDPVGTMKLPECTETQLAEIRVTLGRLKKWIESFEPALQAEVVARGGIDLGDGRRWEMREPKNPTISIDPRLAAAWLYENFGDGIFTMLKPSKSAIETLAKEQIRDRHAPDKPPRGAIKTGLDDLWASLGAIDGAVTETLEPKLTIVKNNE